ncbi:unnamed protein product [Linum trigynum]|uniref:Uncharacterized protein n=1 Tax=Linum trigynum TaxID=586398 RepID=A0AAV2GW41_9ROSI
MRVERRKIGSSLGWASSKGIGDIDDPGEDKLLDEKEEDDVGDEFGEVGELSSFQEEVDTGELIEVAEVELDKVDEDVEDVGLGLGESGSLSLDGSAGVSVAASASRDQVSFKKSSSKPAG